MKRLLGIALCALALLVGCTSVVPSSSEVKLDGTSWKLAGIIDGTTAGPVPGQTVTVQFTADSITGKACNSFSGSFTQAGAAITIGLLASTRMYCAEEGVMDQEATVLEILPTLTSARLDGGTLLLTAPDGRGLMFTTQA